jgi:hypothetical protein
MINIKFLSFGLATCFTVSGWAGVKATCSVGYTQVDHSKEAISIGGSQKDIVIDLKPTQATYSLWWGGTGAYSVGKYSLQFFVGYYDEDPQQYSEATASIYLRLIENSGGKQKVIGAAEVRDQPLASLGRLGGYGVGADVTNVLATQAIQDRGKIPGDFALNYGERYALGLVPDGTVVAGNVLCQFITDKK